MSDGARPALLCIDRSWEAAQPSPASAFDWWYVDARDARGDGLVFIWASALPFFRERAPSVNLALYRGGRPALWLLEQARSSDWSVQKTVGSESGAMRPGGGGEAFRIVLGGNELSLERQGGEVRLRAHLDLAVPGDRRRLTGELAVRGPATLAGPPQRHPHRWTPICPAAHVRAELSFGGAPHFALSAPGYLDRNQSDLPLDALGLARWEWGRVREGGRCTIWYDLEGADASRESHRLEVWGGALSVESRAGGPAGPRPALGRAVERGPFYSRWFAPDGAVVERCEVTKVFDRWHRPLVRMRMHGPRPSFWAPLFCGPAEGRVARLLRLGGRA